MGGLSWDGRKNDRLKRDRGVSFEDVVQAVSDGKVLAIVDHPNQRSYPGQRLMVIDLKGYAYVVPFVEEGGDLRLKTIIPSRKATRDLLKGGRKHG